MPPANPGMALTKEIQMTLTHPGYVFKGKTYKTVNGLLTALMKDCGASWIGMVSSNNTITAYKGANDVAAVFDITPPKFGEKQVVTKHMEMTADRINAIVASAWNTVPRACNDIAMTPDRAADLSKTTKAFMLNSYFIYAANPANKALYTVREIQQAINIVEKQQ
jgi:hypothetical protein